MRTFSLRVAAACISLVPMTASGQERVVFEATSPYHHIRVLDRDGLRVLSFDGSEETRMSLRDPLQGHFEYTEYFHLPWLWQPRMTNVVMIGLGGASTQRAYQHYYPEVTVETAEIDPLVLRVAREYFEFKESPTQRVRIMDGRMHLRRRQAACDAIIVDAYVENRYGSFIPYHLATKEFFELARQRLNTNGVLAYNVIGTLDVWQADIVGSIFQTMKGVFPQVYLCPARESRNVVLLGVNSEKRLTHFQLQQRASALIQSGRVTLPTFRARAQAVRVNPPPGFGRAKVLTDDFAPIDGMLTRGR
jgi:spermidine synthase